MTATQTTIERLRSALTAIDTQIVEAKAALTLYHRITSSFEADLQRMDARIESARISGNFGEEWSEAVDWKERIFSHQRRWGEAVPAGSVGYERQVKRLQENKKETEYEIAFLCGPWC